MSESARVDVGRAEIDYDALIEKASPQLKLYIRTLEQENARLRQEVLELRQLSTRRQRAEVARETREEAAPAALPTIRYPDDVMVITLTSRGLAKRTPLNDYSTQRRGGLGVFDIQSNRDDPVTHLLVARAGAGLLVLSTRGRAFRLPLDTVPLTDIRGRGGSLPERLMFTSDEAIGCVVALDDEHDTRSNLLIVTNSGLVRSVHRTYVGPRLQPGTLLSDPKRGGAPAGMTLSSGGGDVLIALRSGVGYRFDERLIRREGTRGIQTSPDDSVVGIVGVSGDDDEVLLVTADGQGTRRQMAGFSANKTPGGQGKMLIKTGALVGMAQVAEGDEALCITGFAKIIRFAAAEVPAKSSAVQGVSVLDTRGDSLAAVAVVTPPGQA
jgi:DNA gyrase subunit A